MFIPNAQMSACFVIIGSTVSTTNGFVDLTVGPILRNGYEIQGQNYVAMYQGSEMWAEQGLITGI